MLAATLCLYVGLPGLFAPAQLMLKLLYQKRELTASKIENSTFS